MTLTKEGRIQFVLSLFYVDGTDSYQQGDIITTYSISTIVMRSCDFGLPDPFLLFFWSTVFHTDLSF